LDGARSRVSRLAAGHPAGAWPLCRRGRRHAVRGAWGWEGPWVEAEVSVSLDDAWSRLICAGWLPQDRVFGWSGARV